MSGKKEGKFSKFFSTFVHEFQVNLIGSLQFINDAGFLSKISPTISAHWLTTVANYILVLTNQKIKVNTWKEKRNERNCKWPDGFIIDSLVKTLQGFQYICLQVSNQFHRIVKIVKWCRLLPKISLFWLFNWWIIFEMVVFYFQFVLVANVMIF